MGGMELTTLGEAVQELSHPVPNTLFLETLTGLLRFLRPVPPGLAMGWGTWKVGYGPRKCAARDGHEGHVLGSSRKETERGSTG